MNQPSFDFQKPLSPNHITLSPSEGKQKLSPKSFQAEHFRLKSCSLFQIHISISYRNVDYDHQPENIYQNLNAKRLCIMLRSFIIGFYWKSIRLISFTFNSNFLYIELNEIMIKLLNCAYLLFRIGKGRNQIF